MQEKKASENHTTDESSTVPSDDDEPEKASPELTNSTKITQQHVADAELKRGRYTSKSSSNHATWSYVLAASATVFVSVILLVNVWGYVRS